MGAARRWIAAAVALALAACGRGAEPSGAEAVGEYGPLSPRLLDGGASIDLLSGAVGVVREWTFDADRSSPWRAEGAELQPGAEAGWLTLVPRPGARPRLVSTESVDLAGADALEIELALTSRSAVDLRLTGRGAPPLAPIDPIGLAAERGERRVTAVFRLGDAAWRGTVDGLAVEQSTPLPVPLAVRSIRLVRRGFLGGHSPLDAAGDGGVVVLAGEGRRAWPLFDGEPLVDFVDLPARATIRVDVAVLDRARERRPVFRLTIDRADGSRVQRVEWREPATGGSVAWKGLSRRLTNDRVLPARLTFEVLLEDGGPPVDGALALLGSPVVAPPREVPRERPNVLLVTLDTTRYDALGSAFTDRRADDFVHTPFLDGIAEDALVFTDAWSAGNSTQPSHASILTGLSIQDHALFDNYGVLDDSATTLAESLRSEGYATAAFVTFGAIGLAAGFAQGFDRFDPASAATAADGSSRVERAAACIEDWERDGVGPWFLWLHLYDPHTPYRLPEGELEAFAGRSGAPPPPERVEPATLAELDDYPKRLAFLRGVTNEAHARYLYRAEVGYVDRLLEQLFSVVERERTLVAITADHGESLGERFVYYAHAGLTPETLHVPLLVGGPGIEPGRVAARVSNADLTPSILAHLGFADPPPADLFASGELPADRRVWFEHDKGVMVGCRDDRYHVYSTLAEGATIGAEPVAVDGRVSLRKQWIPPDTLRIFDWRADPGLERDLAGERPDLVARYRAAIDDYRASRRALARGERAIDAVEAAQLEALGYAGD